MSTRAMLLLYWGGSIIKTKEGISYDKEHQRSMVVDCTITYEELMNKLNGNKHVAHEGTISSMTCRLPGVVRPHHPVVYSSLVVDDNDAVQSMLQIVNDGVFRNIDLYLDFFQGGTGHEVGDGDVPTFGTFSSMLSQVTDNATRQLSPQVQRNEMPSDQTCDADALDNLYAPCGTTTGFGLSNEDFFDDGDHFFEESGDEGLVSEGHNVGNVGGSSVHEFGPQKRMHEPSSSTFRELDMETIDCGTDGVDGSYHLGSEWDPMTQEPIVGLLFPDKKSIQKSMEVYSVARNRQFRAPLSDKKRLNLICLKSTEEKCNWRVWAKSKVLLGGQWQITRYKGPHTCLYMVEGSDHAQMTSGFVSQSIEAQVRVNPNLTIAQIVQSIQEKHITITKRKACIARNLAIQRVFGNWEESYKELPKFMLAMQKYNPGTIVVFESIPTTPGVCMFHYVFWAISGSIEGFVHCRPLVAIDGTFLTGKYKGVLLIANSVDANGQIFPLAFSIVDSESENSWGFFLRCLRLHVVKNRVGICLISDRSNAIKAAVSRRHNGWAEQPFNVFHCHCIRHYKANFEKRFKSEVLGDLMEQAARKHQERKFKRIMETIKSMNEEAEQWLRTNCPVEKWTLSHDGGRRYGQLTSNLVESFNSLLKGARALPITAMVEAIFYKLSEFFAHRYAKACVAFEESEMAVTPSVHKQISHWQTKAGSHTLKPHHLNQGVYTVVTQRRPRGGGNLQTVNLAEHYCSCGKWAVYQIPCSHVIAVCQKLAYNWKQYVGEELYVRTWKKEYEHTIMPIEHQDYWPQYEGVVYKPNAALRRGRGRPQTRRMSCDMDFKSRKRRGLCKKCNGEGHTARACKAPRPTPSAGRSKD